MVCVGTGPSDMAVGGHEEADTKMSVHLRHALNTGSRTILVTTRDTDIVVILTGLFHALTTDFEGIDIWIGFGSRKDFRYYHVNTLYQEWGERRCRALPFFHAFSGSDTTSQFLGRAKSRTWQTWCAFPDVTAAFMITSEQPFIHLNTSSAMFSLIERFVCLLYDTSSAHSNVNDLRRDMFTTRGKPMESLPPSQVSIA